jgi:hypothetical protein
MDVNVFPKTTRSAFAALVAACAFAACAPNPNGLGVADFGTVTGNVIDLQTQQPIPNATVNIGSGIVGTTDPSGGFVLRNVPVGTQPIHIAIPGWQSYSGTVTVTKDQTTDVGNIQLPSDLAK